MNAALGVQAGEAARRSGDIDAVIASLPVSLRFVASGVELVAIDGGPGWAIAARTAIDEGARGLVVINPVAADAREVADAVQRRGVPVVIDQPFAGNAVLPAAREHFATTGGLHALLECTVTARVGADLSRILMDQLALVGALDREIDSARAVDWTSRRYVVAALTADRRRVRLTCVCTNARPPTALVRQLGQDGSVELILQSPESARPGQATVTNQDGARLLPTLFETAHRVAWRRLVQLVHDGKRADDLTRFAHDSRIATALTEAPN